MRLSGWLSRSSCSGSEEQAPTVVPAVVLALAEEAGPPMATAPVQALMQLQMKLSWTMSTRRRRRSCARRWPLQAQRGRRAQARQARACSAACRQRSLLPLRLSLPPSPRRRAGLVDERGKTRRSSWPARQPREVQELLVLWQHTLHQRRTPVGPQPTLLLQQQRQRAALSQQQPWRMMMTTMTTFLAAWAITSSPRRLRSWRQRRLRLLRRWLQLVYCRLRHHRAPKPLLAVRRVDTPQALVQPLQLLVLLVRPAKFQLQRPRSRLALATLVQLSLHPVLRLALLLAVGLVLALVRA